MTKLLLLARHASTEATRRGAYAGRLDIALGAGAKAEIDRLAATVGPYSPTGIVCSPRARARQTAEGVAAALGLPSQNIKIREELREVDFGRWEGLTFPEIAAAEPEKVREWAEWSEDFRFPEGERLGDFLDRIGRVTGELAAGELAAGEEERLLVVSHGGVIRAMLCRLLGLSPRHYLLFDVQPAGLAVVRLFGELGVLTALYPAAREEK